jgi:hypothetical protein
MSDESSRLQWACAMRRSSSKMRAAFAAASAVRAISRIFAMWAWCFVRRSAMRGEGST